MTTTEPFGPPVVPPEYVALWRLVEICHSFIYFADERVQRYSQLGLKGGWMGYFATRSAALGVAPPELVTACFYNFKHTMVARALPDAWSYTSPEIAYEARLQVADDALARLAGNNLGTPGIAEVAEIVTYAAQSTELGGRPLAAAHRGLRMPEATHLKLFWACSILREYRGDTHNLVLASEEIDGCQAHVLMRALNLVPGDQRDFRGWTLDDWSEATASLQFKGWLDENEGITTAGRQARASIEQRTDQLCRRPWDVLENKALQRTITLLTPLATQIVSQGGLTYPNAIGTPPISEPTPDT